MSTVEELRRVLAEIANSAKTDTAEKVIRQRIAQMERDAVAQWQPRQQD
ncbi:hypothetical protein C8D87_11754 [Lentzea atacamensis]|uniref:Uncharacterized protein n=1 Tax=Lentzea atacamensis TaxID=531938 RepID=A0ABX9DXD4_9PSEU|nr:hypothetical protein [Lentzea atacamensis]RAS58884.1 hypothetical protein C8D87_11754 [Lentzea atacamensis]